MLSPLLLGLTLAAGQTILPTVPVLDNVPASAPAQLCVPSSVLPYAQINYLAQPKDPAPFPSNGNGAGCAGNGKSSAGCGDNGKPSNGCGSNGKSSNDCNSNGKNGNGFCSAQGDKDKGTDDGGFFFRRLCRAYKKQFTNKDNGDDEEEPPRRALPSPWSSPPFPGNEYQGYPLIGVPESTAVYPFMEAVYGGPWGEEIKESRIKLTGWATASGNWSQAHNSNTPDSYWIVPNHFELEQLVFKIERYADTVQTDHIDWGFRSVGLYGIDYRYTTAGGWGSAQLLKHNLLDGWDPTEQYFNVYIPWIGEGTDIRVGRWIACPDIETQYSVDNYLASHSLLFTYDTYTQTGVMVTTRINEQWMVQGVIHAGTDMAPWYPGAIPTGAFGVRWVAMDNNNAMYAWLNAINNAEFRRFEQYGQPLGHDNFNYFVATWEHRFTEKFFTKTEGYYMWERNAMVGGTPSAGPVEPFGGGGGGSGALIPGYTQAYGILNYTMLGLSKRDYLTFRNEWWKDESGFRSGFRGTYTSHTLGLSHQFNDVLMLRPEIGYYRNWHENAFDLGTRQGTWIYGFDVTLRF